MADTDKPVTKKMDENMIQEFSVYGYLKKHYKNIVIVILIVAIAGTYLWGRITTNILTKDFDAKYEQLLNNALEFSEEKDFYYLEMFSYAYSLAVLSELPSGNLRLLGEYSASLVRRYKNIRGVLITDALGDVRSATNIRYEGTSLRDYYKSNEPITEIQIIRNKTEDTLIAASPITHNNIRVGYLIIITDIIPFRAE